MSANFAELPFIDSAAHYTSAAAGKWTTFGGWVANATNSRTGISGTGGLHNGGGGGGTAFLMLLGTYTTLYCGVALRRDSQLFNSQHITFTQSGFNAFTPVAFMQGEGDGTLKVVLQQKNGGITQQQVISSAFGLDGRPLSNNTWYYFEMRVTISATILSADFYVNGHQEVNNLTLTLPANNNWGAVEINNWTINAPNDGFGTNASDIYLNQDGIKGDSVVIYLKANNNGAYTQWTSNNNGVPNWNEVNAIPNVTSPTAFVFTNGVNNKDAYALQSLPASANTIFAVQSTLWMAKDAAATATVQPLYHSNNTDFFGENFNPSVGNYQFFREGSANSVFTNNSWTVAEINAINFGENRSA